MKMSTHPITRRAISVLATGVLLALPAAAQQTQAAEPSLAELLASDDATREQMAMHLLRALEVAELAPPDCVPGQEMFDDVPASSPFCPFIEELVRLNVTSGCGGDDFCPAAPVTHAQMAAFLVRMRESALAEVLRISIVNRSVGDSGCESGELAVRIKDGNGEPVSHRFMFQVPGPTPAYGQISLNGNIGSAVNVSDVSHAFGSGLYCIQFDTVPTNTALWSTVVSLHAADNL